MSDERGEAKRNLVNQLVHRGRSCRNRHRRDTGVVAPVDVVGEPKAMTCSNCERDLSDCRCGVRRAREDDRRRAERHHSETEDAMPNWDDVVRAMEDGEG